MLLKSDERFGRLFGHSRGVTRARASGPLPDAYAALTDTDLDTCAALIGDEPRAVSLLRAAKSDRLVLDGLGDETFMRLQALRATALTGGAQGSDDELCARLAACFTARELEWERQLRARGGRPLSMYSDAGNIALAQLLDTLAGLDAASAAARLSAGMAMLASRGHREVHDTAVRESIASELESTGFEYERVMN